MTLACYRAACYLKMDKYVDAKADCDAVIWKDEKNVKALFRRGQANAALKVHAKSVQARPFI